MLEIIDLAKRYGPVVALDGATFSARPGPDRRLPRARTAPARRPRCAASSGWPGPIAARSAGRARSVDRDARLRFGYMPEQRGLYPRMRVAEQLSYFAQQHGLPGKAANAAAAALARADGPRRPGEVEARGAVARQPAAGPAGDRARPRPGAARPRRAVLGPRPDRHRDDDRGHPRAGRGRRRRRLLEPPARPRRGRLRGRRDHRPRPDRRLGRHRGAQGARRAASTSRSRSSAPDGAWLDGVRRRSPCSSAPATGSSCSSTGRSTSTACSRGRGRPARSGRFAYQPPKLSELFMEAVAPDARPQEVA